LILHSPAPNLRPEPHQDAAGRTSPLEKYAEIAAQRHGVLKRLPDGKWFATIPDFEGVWASELTPEQTLEVLEEVVLDWVLLKIQHKDKDLPVLEEIDLNVL
jgi:predicted RNase H-like HicB family nuclease